MARATTSESLRELAFRESDGLEVTLHWEAVEDRLIVSVYDTKRHVFFSVDAPRDKALDVFNHPFAYASSRPAPRTDLLLAV
jgi:hypothetical protein